MEYGNGDSIRYDSFSIQATPVPEPGTLALLGLGSLALLARLRGRSKPVAN